MHFVKIRKIQYDNFRLAKSLYFRDFQVFTNNKFFFPVSNKFYTIYNEKFPPPWNQIEISFFRDADRNWSETRISPKEFRPNFHRLWLRNSASNRFVTHIIILFYTFFNYISLVVVTRCIRNRADHERLTKYFS